MKLIRYLFKPRANLFDAICIGLGLGVVMEFGLIAWICYGLVCCAFSTVIETYLERDTQ